MCINVCTGWGCPLLKIENQSVQILESDCRDRAEEFSREKFQKEMTSLIQDTWLKAGKNLDNLLIEKPESKI